MKNKNGNADNMRSARIFTNLPIDLQIDALNTEKLNDDDCELYCLLCTIIDHPNSECPIIRYTNSVLSHTVNHRFSREFIRESLGRLKREGMIEVEIKHHTPTGNPWREITLKNPPFTITYFGDWARRRAVKFALTNPEKRNGDDEYVTNDLLQANFRIDTQNEEPLSDDDCKVFALLLYFESLSENRIVGLSNFGLSASINSHFSPAFIYESLGRLEREGLIKVAINAIPQTAFLWREISILDGFSEHPVWHNWISKYEEVHPSQTTRSSSRNPYNSSN